MLLKANNIYHEVCRNAGPRCSERASLCAPCGADCGCDRRVGSRGAQCQVDQQTCPFTYLGFVVNSLSYPGPKTRLSSFPSGRGDFSRQFPFGDFLPSGVLASIVSPAVRRRAVATAHNATMSVSGLLLLLLLLLPPWLSSVTSSPHDGEEQHTMIRRAHAGGAHNSRTPPSSVFQFADVQCCGLSVPRCSLVLLMDDITPEAGEFVHWLVKGVSMCDRRSRACPASPTALLPLLDHS